MSSTSSAPPATLAPRLTPEDFLDDSTKECQSGVIAYRFAECPTFLSPDGLSVSPEGAERIEELKREAGDDINRQITAAQEIQNIVNGSTPPLDATLCKAVQGFSNADQRVLASRTEHAARIAELLETTCPGNLDLLIG